MMLFVDVLRPQYLLGITVRLWAKRINIEVDMTPFTDLSCV